jgi:AraC-like DNA-binding protein
VLEQEILQRLCRARDRLREPHESRLAIGEVAREAQMSRYHFIRRFVALFGETPHQFRIRSRLDHARHLLAAGQHSVREVCMEVGFTSLGSFSALFTRRVGVPPSAYRRRVRPAELIPGCLTLMCGAPSAIFEKHPGQPVPDCEPVSAAREQP